MGSLTGRPERPSAAVLVGMTVDEAERYLDTHAVYFGLGPHPVTELRVSEKDGEYQCDTELKESGDIVRLNVHTRNDTIVRVSNVG